MDKIKEKYEIMLGFVTLAISFSFLNTEFSKIIINLGYLSIPLNTYFLMTIISFGISIYLYLLEKIFRDTKIGTWKIWNVVILIGYWLFAITLIAPIVLISIFVITKISNLALKNYQNAFLVSSILSSILSVLSVIFSGYFSNRIVKEQKEQKQMEIEEKEIIGTENIKRLYKDGYYSHVVIEAFKLVENHLRKKLLEKNVRVPSFNFSYVLNFSLELGIINTRELSSLKDLRGLRNEAAHSSVQYTEKQAKFALDVAREILKF